MSFLFPSLFLSGLFRRRMQERLQHLSLIAATTDWLDGWLARRWQQESAFGAFLDPVADKLMVAAALVLLVDAFDSTLVTLSAVVIIGREIVVSALREWMSEIGQRAHVAVSWLGKVKTAAQMLAITLCLALPVEETLLHLGLWILVIAALLTLWSMGTYLSCSVASPRSRPLIEIPSTIIW